MVAVVFEGSEPRVVLSTILETCALGDRLSSDPYRVAAEMKRNPQGGASVEAMAAVAEGRRRQNQLAAKGLEGVVVKLTELKYRPVVAALLVNRAGWITDLLEYSLAWQEHVPVAEGLAVRDAIRFALKHCAVRFTEMDEKSLPNVAAQELNLSPAHIEARLKAFGATVGRPWRKEQKLACLSAWVAVAALDTRNGTNSANAPQQL